MDEQIWLNKITFEFTQDGNTLGTTDEIEILTVEAETQSGSITEECPFYVLHTDTGWSFDSKEDMDDVLDTVTKAIDAVRDF